MKTKTSRFFIWTLASSLLIACSPELGDEGNDDRRDSPVDVIVSTRNTITTGNEEADIKFTPGCLIGISVDGSEKYKNVKYRYPNSGSQLEPLGNSIYWESKLAIMNINAYYPYRDDGDYAVSYVEADQSEESGYFASDALKTIGTIEKGTMTLSDFEHRMAKVIFQFDVDVSDVKILYQSLNTGSSTGNSEIKTYRAEQKWKACIVPGQNRLSISGRKNGKTFNMTLRCTAPLAAGEQYTYRVKSWIDTNGATKINLSEGNAIIDDSKSYYIMQGSSDATNHSIIVKKGNPTIYIADLDVSAGTAIDIKTGTPTIILIGNNKLKSTQEGMSGICLSSEDANVIIKGTGSLTDGTLTVQGSYGGAGIGPTLGGSCGNIKIEGGIINASAVSISNDGGAGIGSTRNHGKCGDITIENATVTAEGVTGGAGIGSGWDGGSCGNITITNSTISAIGSDCSFMYSAAIGVGGASYCTCDDIIITLKAGQTQDQFLQNCIATGDKVKTSSGYSVTWKN